MSNAAHPASTLDIAQALADLASAPPPAPDEPSHPQDLSDATSLDDLLTAILGAQARGADDRGPLREVVDTQIRELRGELGIAEPVVARTLTEPLLVGVSAVYAAPDGELEGDVPAWRKLMSGLGSRLWHPVVVIVIGASGAW